MNVLEANAFQSAFYRTHDRTVDATPDWEDLTSAEQWEHITTCEGCDFCPDRRWCEPCGTDAIPVDDGQCHNCGATLPLSIPADRLGEH